MMSGKLQRTVDGPVNFDALEHDKKALRATEDSFRLIIDSIPGLVHTMTPGGDLEFVNQRNLDYFGKTLEELKGWVSSDVFHPDDLPRAIDSWNRTHQAGQPDEIECRFRRADGVYRWFQLRCLPQRDSEGRIIRWISLHTDIDDRKRMEEALRSSEQHLRLIVDCIPGLVNTTTAEGEVEFFNQRILQYFGKRDEELQNWVTSNIVHPDDLPAVIAAFASSIKTGEPYNIEQRFRRADGVYRWFQVRALPARDSEGRIIRWYSLHTDIDDLKKAEAELRRSEAYLSEAQKLSHTGSFGWDVSSGEIHWSQETFRIFECEPTAKVTIELILQRTHPEDRSAVAQVIERASRERTKFDCEHRLLLPDGTVKHLRVVGSPSKDEWGRFEFVGAVTDITDRRRAEERLRRSEAYLLEAQRLSHTGSWRFDVLSGVVTGSPEAYRIFGVKPDDQAWALEVFRNRIHPEDLEALQRISERAQKEKADYEADYRIILPDGSIKHLHSVGHSVLNESGDVVEVFGTTMDITAQWQAKAELEKAFEEIKRLKDRLQDENLALREQIDRALMFEEIVGTSPALQAVLSRVSKVAPTDSTVLVTGETGTGKELIARAIHKRSRRSSRAFVSVNCAAIPSSLIASELFGHEKGAFTGALQRRLGRFELADEGTIFLDEVGELPAETQITLLRVLQEREYERVGGTQHIRANVRVIAATNRDLEAAIAAGTFRSDLFYRLNVFPIEIPPLRQRGEDIPMLVEYFIDHFSRKAGKRFRGINKKTLDLLLSYPWPGNIRELQNVVERSVIVCETENFSVDESWLSRQPVASEPKDQLELSQRLAAEEKDMIEAALRESGGRVAGPSGAAAKLGIHRSTLDSKITSLKINKYRFKDSKPTKK